MVVSVVTFMNFVEPLRSGAGMFRDQLDERPEGCDWPPVRLRDEIALVVRLAARHRTVQFKLHNRIERIALGDGHTDLDTAGRLHSRRLTPG